LTKELFDLLALISTESSQ